MILGGKYSKASKCTTKSELISFANTSRLFKHAEGNDIYEATGCLSSCEKDQYGLKADPLETEVAYKDQGDILCELHLKFVIMDSSYKEEIQYIIYDVDSFIADVG